MKNTRKTTKKTIGSENNGLHSRLVVSPDCKRIAYVVCSGFGGGFCCLIVDGKKLSNGKVPFFEVVNGMNSFDWFSDIVFSPNSQRLALIAGMKGKIRSSNSNGGVYDPTCVVLLEENGDLWLYRIASITEPDNPVFSSDSKRVACRMKESGFPGSEQIWVDGKIISYYSVSAPIFSPDSEHIAYTASGWNCQARTKFMVVDGKELKEYYRIEFGTVSFSPYSEKLAYLAQDLVSGKWVLVLNKLNKTDVTIREENLDNIFSPRNKYGYSAKKLIFSPDSQHITFIVRCYNWRWGFTSEWVVLDGQKGKKYKEIIPESLKFSPDSNRIGYIAKRGFALFGRNKEVVVIDGGEGKKYDSTPFLLFSPDSKRVAYIAERGSKWLVVVDEREGKEYDMIKLLSFSPDSKRVAYIAERGSKWLVVVDEREGKEYDMIKFLSFSPDSKRVAYIAERGLMSLVTVDEREGEEYNIIYGDKFCWDTSYHFHYVASGAGEYLVDEELVG